MPETNKPKTDSAGQIFKISRSFDAPRDLVWKVFTEPDHLVNWWGPKGFTVKSTKLDLRPGGIFHYCLKTPEGNDMWGKFAFREIQAPEKMVFISTFSDEHGGVTRHPMAPQWPLEMLTTYLFAERDRKTTFTVEWMTHNASDEERKFFENSHEGMNQGWTGTFDQLDAYLASLTQNA